VTIRTFQANLQFIARCRVSQTTGNTKTITAALATQATLRLVTGVSATLASTSNMAIDVVFRDRKQGQLDPATDSIKPLSQGRWSDLRLTKWSNWNSYVINEQQIIWTSQLLDLQSVTRFTMNVSATYTGTLDEYRIHVSETGLFQGEETETRCLEGNYNIPSFYGRYAYVTVYLTGGVLQGLQITGSQDYKEVKVADVDTSTLPGTASSRTLTLPNPVSGVKEMIITCKTSTAYAVNLYVSDTATSQVLIPMVIDKSALTFRLTGIDNEPRNGIIDATVVAFPRQAMINGQILTV
jgi:hypothetical protein